VPRRGAGYECVGGQPSRRPDRSNVAFILLVLLLAILFGAVGFAVHVLWVVAVIIFVLWAIGWVISAAEGGSRRRWYRRY
jgi:hypothetical protein